MSGTVAKSASLITGYVGRSLSKIQHANLYSTAALHTINTKDKTLSATSCSATHHILIPSVSVVIPAHPTASSASALPTSLRASLTKKHSSKATISPALRSSYCNKVCPPSLKARCLPSTLPSARSLLALPQVFDTLNCPQLGKFDQSLFNQFPGHTYSPTSPATNY